MTERDWAAWHESYDRPDSTLRRRLAVVQRRIGQVLDAAADGPIRVVSMCAGQGRDLLGVLADHPRRHDVRARLVELEPRNAADAERTARSLGLPGIEVVTGDASSTTAYEGAVPAELVLVCGVFGNVPDDHIRHTIGELPGLCAPGATVVWTRHREPPDLTPTVRGWFAECGFDEVAFDFEPGHPYGVGTHRLVRAPQPYRAGVRLFSFTGEPV